MAKLCLALRRGADIHVPGELQWLTASERIRHQDFGSAQRRKTFLAGRWLLRELLALELGGAAAAHAVEIDGEGRSRAAAGYVNLSHSGDWCVAAWSETPIGVDLEVLRPRTDLLALARRVASPHECEQLTLTAEPARLQAFYALWTRKEAWLKSQGRGLDFALMRELSFEPLDGDGDAACVHLAHADLQLAVCGARLRALPEQLAGEPLAWQRYRRLTP